VAVVDVKDPVEKYGKPEYSAPAFSFDIVNGNDAVEAQYIGSPANDETNV
jgi:hypothetical protein